MPVTGKIDRKYMAHLIDSGLLCGGETSEYERLGEDLEEYNVELNPEKRRLSTTDMRFLLTRIRIMRELTAHCLLSCRRLLTIAIRMITAKQMQLKHICGMEMKHPDM